MSTTKDKSQGPYTVDSSGYWVMTSLGGYREVAHFDLQSQAKIVCDELNAAYSAGQADRDELVKALQRAEDELHKRYAHPDYEYEHSTTGRKQPDLKGEQLESEGWEEYKFQRDEWTDSRSYRRLKTITPNP